MRDDHWINWGMIFWSKHSWSNEMKWCCWSHKGWHLVAAVKERNELLWQVERPSQSSPLKSATVKNKSQIFSFIDQSLTDQHIVKPLLHCRNSEKSCAQPHKVKKRNVLILQSNPSGKIYLALFLAYWQGKSFNIDNATVLPVAVYPFLS